MSFYIIKSLDQPFKAGPISNDARYKVLAGPFEEEAMAQSQKTKDGQVAEYYIGCKNVIVK